MIADLFTILGCLALFFGLLSLPTALFVAPHILAFALGWMAFGICNFVVASGLRRKAKWATWRGIALCAVPVSVAVFAVYQAAASAEWDSVAVWGSVATFFAVMTFAVYTRRTEVGE